MGPRIALRESRWVAAASRRRAALGDRGLVRSRARPRAGAPRLHAAVPIVRGIRHKPAAATTPGRGEGAAPRTRWTTPPGATATRCCSGTACPTTSRRHGGISMPRPIWPGIFPATQIIINHTGLPADRSPEALAAWRRALEGRRANRTSQSRSPASGCRAALDSSRPTARHPRCDRDLRPDRAMFASNFPVDSLVGDFERSSRAS